MTDLEAYYLAALPGRIGALQSALRTVDEDDARATIRRIAHSLKGSGASYGFPEISEVAAAAEVASDADLAVRTRALLDVLEAAVAEAAPQADESQRILVVEDDPEMAHLIRTVLAGPGRVVECVGDIAGAELELRKSPPALVVLDLLLPDGDGRTLLMRIRERAATASVPVVVLSAATSPRAMAECLALGADQVVPKPVDPGALGATVSRQLQRTTSAGQAMRRDSLTNLPNRAAFVEAYTSALEREEAPVLIAKIDLDRFSAVNDALGRVQGDAFLQGFATLGTETLARADAFARWGGDEFAALYAGGGAAHAEEELRALVERTREMHADARDGAAATLSVGLADVSDGPDVDEAVARADYYLYLAKATGRDRFVSEGSGVETPTRRILLAEDDDLTASLIVHRLEREGFDVEHYEEGTLALEAARSSRFSLAILDVKMPGMDGFEVLRELRAIRGFRETPILMLTSMGGEADVVRGFDLGATDYVLKPFSPVELVARVHRHLRR